MNLASELILHCGILLLNCIDFVAGIQPLPSNATVTHLPTALDRNTDFLHSLRDQISLFKPLTCLAFLSIRTRDKKRIRNRCWRIFYYAVLQFKSSRDSLPRPLLLTVLLLEAQHVVNTSDLSPVPWRRPIRSFPLTKFPAEMCAVSCIFEKPASLWDWGCSSDEPQD
ncbi:hypothetical protein BDZ89DRAFT_569068 [Hymenopellis radicata]|nr:hypothetical protein BDZ89DRAFT_569068 [Hymenopellis radicata]